LEPKIKHDKDWFNSNYQQINRIADEWKYKAKQDPVELYWNQTSNAPLQPILFPGANWSGCMDAYTTPIFKKAGEMVQYLNHLREIGRSMKKAY